MSQQYRRDNTWAILSHLSVILPQWGWLCPLIVFLSHRDRDRFVSQNAAQALVWQLVEFGTVMVVSFVSVFAIMLTMFRSGAFERGPTFAPHTFFSVWAFTLIGYLAFHLYFVIVAVVAALAASRGEIYEYPIVGGLASRLGG